MDILASLVLDSIDQNPVGTPFLSSISAVWLSEGGQALTLGYTHVFDSHIPENFLINAESTINMRWFE